MKTICIDYDGTYDVFPELMDMVINFAKNKGHRIILCTMRNDSNERESLVEIEKKFDAVYYTNRKAKKQFLNNLGEYPSIWIDDNPYWILNNG